MYNAANISFYPANNKDIFADRPYPSYADAYKAARILKIMHFTDNPSVFTKIGDTWYEVWVRDDGILMCHAEWQTELQAIPLAERVLS